jgi:putative transcriptional regulator
MTSGSGWVRAFLGYAGWGEGQLEGELEQKAWQVCTPDVSLFEDRYLNGLWSVFVSGDDRWRRLIQHMPDDPEMN